MVTCPKSAGQEQNGAETKHIGNCEEELPKKPVGRQSTDRLRKKKNCVKNEQVAYISGKTCRPSVGQQTADSRPTGFLGSSSSQLPTYYKAIDDWTSLSSELKRLMPKTIFNRILKLFLFNYFNL